MKSYPKIIWLLTMIVLMNLMPNIALSQISYEVTDLGTLGGTYSYAYGINSFGRIVGESTTASGATHAFIYSGGQMSDLGTLGGISSSSLGINDSGLAVGGSTTASGATHAFIYSGGQMTDLGAFGGTYSYAYGINSIGQVVGGFTTASGSHAIIYSGGQMTDLGTLGGTYSWAQAINSTGQAVGGSTTIGDAGQHAFIFSGGQMTDLGTLGGTHSVAMGINASGQVVGSSNITGSMTEHAFLYSGGQMIDLGTLGGTYSFAFGINSSGQVVGSAYAAGDAAELAFLYSGGQMIDLNSRIPSNSGWILGRAQAINDQGQIVGLGSHNGQNRAFLLNPTSQSQPTLQVLAPNGGETLYKGTDYTVKWNSSNYSGSIRIQVYHYTKGNKFDAYTLSSSEPVENGSQGIIFNPPGNWPSDSKYKIAISTLDGSVYDFSERYFSILDSQTVNSGWPLDASNMIASHMTNELCDDSYPTHLGIDIIAPFTSPVYSICPGEVVVNNTNTEANPKYTTKYDQYWNAVLIVKHYCGGTDPEVYGYYGHIKSNLSAGPVDQGTIIGYIREAYKQDADGNDVRSPNTDHLHFGLNLNKVITTRWGYARQGTTCMQIQKNDWTDPIAYFSWPLRD